MTRVFGLIAGQGALPLSIAKCIQGRGDNVFCVRVEGLGDPALSTFEGETINLGKIAAMINALKNAGCKEVIFAGYITRPDFAKIDFDATGRALLPEIIQAAAQGDNAVLCVFIKAFEQAGFTVLGGQEAYPELLCAEGLLTDTPPDTALFHDMRKGFHIAGIIGSEDIGQACVVREGVVLAVEAQEGTDAMLMRAGQLDTRYRSEQGGKIGALVKRAKPGQDLRIDLPVIGVRTVQLASEAGLSGIALEAGASLIIDSKRVIEAANKASICIFGLTGQEPA